MFMIMAGMDPCILLWVILLIAFVVGELITVGLTSIWFAAGSLVALLSSSGGKSGCTDYTVSGGCRGIACSDKTVGKKIHQFQNAKNKRGSCYRRDYSYYRARK